MRRARWDVLRVAMVMALLLAAEAPAGARQKAVIPPPEGEAGPRYKFIERYADPKDDRNPPGAIGQYRVAYRRSLAITTDQPRGTPSRKEYSQDVIYTERPAQLSGAESGKITSLVRRYDSARSKPEPNLPPQGPRPLEGLTIWYHDTKDDDPEILSLTPKRRLRDQEFRDISDQVVVPDLVALLPTLPIRKGDHWRVTEEGEHLLLGDVPREGQLNGTFLEIRDDPTTGGRRVAVLEIVGHLVSTAEALGIRARVHFAFDAPPGDAPKDENATIDAVGAIVKLSLGQLKDTGVNGADDKLRIKTTRQLVLERRLGAEGPPLEIPSPAPKATPENSWVLYVDPLNKFTFRFPQDLRSTLDKKTGRVELRSKDGDLDLLLRFVEKESLKPEVVFKSYLSGPRVEKRIRFTPGDYRTLKWEGVRAFRHEALMKLEGPADAEGAPQQHIDCYLVQFAQDAAFIAEATTTQDPPADARKEVESVLKTFKVGPPPKED